MCDVFFARLLKKHNHVLWVSANSRPDLGGKEEDDNRLMMETEDFMSVEINEPGAYSSICVELNIHSLCVCAVLQVKRRKKNVAWSLYPCTFFLYVCVAETSIGTDYARNLCFVSAVLAHQRH